MLPNFFTGSPINVPYDSLLCNESLDLTLDDYTDQRLRFAKYSSQPLELGDFKLGEGEKVIEPRFYAMDHEVKLRYDRPILKTLTSNFSKKILPRVSANSKDPLEDAWYVDAFLEINGINLRCNETFDFKKVFAKPTLEMSKFGLLKRNRSPKANKMYEDLFCFKTKK
jgi:hypothetical protein